MFLYEFLITVSCFTLILALLSLPIAYLQPNIPTLHVYRYLLKQRIIVGFDAWLMLALIFCVAGLDMHIQLWLQLILLLPVLYFARRAIRVQKQFFEEELQHVQNTLDPPREPIEESNLSEDAVRTTLKFALLGTLFVTAVMACQGFQYLYHPEEYIIGSGMVAIMVLLHFIVAFINMGRISQDDFPEITPENSDEICKKLVEFRDSKSVGGKPTYGTLLVLLIWIPIYFGAFYCFYTTPFAQEISGKSSLDLRPMLIKATMKCRSTIMATIPPPMIYSSGW
jgi:hypothetical protein